MQHQHNNYRVDGFRRSKKKGKDLEYELDGWSFLINTSHDDKPDMIAKKSKAKRIGKSNTTMIQ